MAKWMVANASKFGYTPGTMVNQCKRCNLNFEITDEDLKFYESVSPVFAGKKYLIPSPTHCPDCRQQRRLAPCNEMNLYPGQCCLCKKHTLNEYPPQAKQSVLCYDCWYSDKWDPRDYGCDFDFSRPFFEQIGELRQKVPAQALTIDGLNVNSEFIHYAGSSKNCYLIMHADFCEDCYYGYGFKDNKCCVDGFYNLHCELCYDCTDCHKCYGLKGCQDCINSSSSAFLKDCIGCKSCFLCVGLRERQYCFENEQLLREEYEKRMAEIDLGSYREYMEFKARRREIEEGHVFKYYHGHNLQNCLGDYLVNCKDAWFSFDCEDVEGAKFCYQLVLGSKNVYDIYQYGTMLQQSYECSISGAHGYHLIFVQNGHMACSDLIYCWYLGSCKNCFGCTNMHHKQYCILNKQYTREQYEQLVPQIIEHMQKTGEWGEFFPMSMSPFGYNKTTAQLYYPMTKEQVLAEGLRWDDYELPVPDVARVVEAEDLLDNIKDVSEEILNWAIKCEKTGRLFKITPQELKFYRKQKLPLPRRFWQQRHLDRFAQRNPRKFWRRQCGKCGKDIVTTYAPEGRFAMLCVCCEECYEKEVY